MRRDTDALSEDWEARDGMTPWTVQDEALRDCSACIEKSTLRTSLGRAKRQGGARACSFGVGIEGARQRRETHHGWFPVGLELQRPHRRKPLRAVRGCFSSGLTAVNKCVIVGERMPDASLDNTRAHALARVGKIIRGKYRLDGLVGVGGMAAVYSATHRNGFRVAIKILHEWAALDEQIQRLFRREVTSSWLQYRLLLSWLSQSFVLMQSV